MNLFILSENEKTEILNLHKKFINEENAVEVTPGVVNDKVLELQNLLKTKFGSSISADSKLGPKTIDSAIRALLGQEQLKPSVKVKSKVTPKAKVTPKVVTNTETPPKTDVSTAEKLMSNPWSNPLEKKYALPTGDIKLNSNSNDVSGQPPKQENPEV